MATSGLKIAQVFNVYDVYTPSKASIYLKVKNAESEIDYFNVSAYDSSVPLWGAVIDALNFISLTQNSQKLMAFDDVPDYTGEGFLKAISFSNSPSSNAMVYYPIKSDEDHKGSYTVWIRARTITGQIRLRLYLDDSHVSTIEDNAVPDDSWRWYNANFNLNHTSKKNFGIEIDTLNVAIDKIYIAPSALDTPPVSVGHDFTDSPYITVHGELYTVDSLGRPEVPLYIYDYKTTAGELRFNGWYNFDLSFIDSNWATSFTDRYAFVLFSSGSLSNKYILWEFGDVDPYVCGPSAIKNTNIGVESVSLPELNNLGYYRTLHGLANMVSNRWYTRFDKGYYINIYEYFDSLDEYGEKI
ncbi:MAG: hypothetical protein GF329_10845, partial [Candidatus Lokiarchaeota archaeon]|nr:hypothetical protein [Candidatus Lokiarchaeota archaeon]